ncbi:MAG: magnesium transporter CorA family protein [Phycisphaerae bacterium]
MIRRLRICETKLVESDAANAQIHVYVNPDEAEKRYLIDTLKLDEHTLNSALDPDELARLEFEPEHLAMILKRPRNYSSADSFLFKVESTGLYLFKDLLVIVVPEETPLFEGRPFNRVRDLLDVVLKIIYRAIFHFEEHLRVINMISGELEQEINTSMTNKHLLNLFTLEKSLVYYLNAISTNGKVVDKLRTHATRIGFSPENVEFIEDVAIENSQCYGQAEIYSQVLSGLMDARVSVVSNNLNVLMKTLTLVMIGIMLPTLVISVFSMNVKLPLEQEHSLVPFWIIMALAAISVLVVLGIWRHKKL